MYQHSINFLKYKLKEIIAYFLYYSGILAIIKSIKLKEKALILLYHRVLNPDQQQNTYSQNGIVVSAKTFDKHMKFLKKNFNIVDSLEFEQQLINERSFKNSTCLITFDDGWKDNYTNAFPILKKLEIPALIFLSYNFINNDQMFWQESLNMYLKLLFKITNSNHTKIEFISEFINNFELNEIVDSNSDKKELKILDYIKIWKFKPEKERKEFLDSFEKLLEINSSQLNKCDYFMNWSEVLEMVNKDITFGSHGMNHKISTQISLDQLVDELSNSKIELEKKLKKDIHTFSYPNGNFNQESIEQVQKQGYRLAFTTEQGFVNSNSKSLAIPRINIHEDVTKNIPMFVCRILGIF